MPTIDLLHLPHLLHPEALGDATVIVVDLLRASTTICTALSAGAECVMPFAEIEETLAAARQFGRGNVILGGERHGKLIPGFDLSNSPAEYTPDVVAGRRILFTTTNGARALDYARCAQRVLVGCLANATAVANAVDAQDEVVILCAGTDGKVAAEDVIAGGAIIEALQSRSPGWTLSPKAATFALDLWKMSAGSPRPSGDVVPQKLLLTLEATDGGQNLHDIGRWMDVERCAHTDVLTVVPELNAATGELRIAVAPPSSNG
jgi:2-phosphosulfolactate phosphatase